MKFSVIQSQKCSSHTTFDRKLVTDELCQNEGIDHKKRLYLGKRGYSTEKRPSEHPRMMAGDPRMIAEW